MLIFFLADKDHADEIPSGSLYCHLGILASSQVGTCPVYTVRSEKYLPLRRDLG